MIPQLCDIFGDACTQFSFEKELNQKRSSTSTSVVDACQRGASPIFDIFQKFQKYSAQNISNFNIQGSMVYFDDSRYQRPTLLSD